MNIFKFLAIKSLLSNQVLLKVSKGNRFVFLLHDISAVSENHHSFHYSTTPEVFEKQINLLSRLFEIIPLDRIVSDESLPSGKNYAAITFDDGFYSVFKTARPLLKRLGIPYTVFLNKSAVEENQIWVTNLQIQRKERSYANKLGELAGLKLPLEEDTLFEMISGGKFSNKFRDTYKLADAGDKIYMSQEEIKTLIEEGVTIGNHTMDHFVLSSCDPSLMHEQISENATYMNEQFDIRSPHFAIPFGNKSHYTDEVIHEIRKTGHAHIYSTNAARFKENDVLTKNFLVPRIGVFNQSPMEMMFTINRSFLHPLESVSPPPADFKYEVCDFTNSENLLKLYRLCFKKALAPNYFTWKFLHNPSGRGIGFIASYQDELIGFYGLVAEGVNVNGQHTICYQAVDIMTSPRYRRIGVFEKLVQFSAQYFKERNLTPLLFSFPGKTAYAGFFKKLGWRNLIEFNYLFLKKIFFKMQVRRSQSSDCQMKEITSFGPEFTSYFKERERSYLPVEKTMDTAIANWRLVGHPEIKHHLLTVSVGNQLVGFVAYKLDEKSRAFIVMLDFRASVMYSKYLPAICQFLFAKTDIQDIYTFRPTNKHMQAAYREMGFLETPLSAGPFSHRVQLVVSGETRIGEVDGSDPDNFDLQPISRDY
jgi:peptidoglycan/xylan/chitin deacetylase (PgdA/CDA1 family)/GNAT superfamily N-acetyltransferase